MWLMILTDIWKLCDQLSQVSTGDEMPVFIVQSAEVHSTAEGMATKMMFFRLGITNYMLIIMLRFFKAYRAQPRLAMVTSTLYSASSDLFHFLIVFITIFVSYALSGVLLFGRRLKSFSSPMYALTTCFNLVLGEFDWPDIAAEHPSTAMIWFMSFMVLVFLVMTNMLLAIIMDVYTEVK